MNNKAYIKLFALIAAACIAIVVQGFTHVVPLKPLSPYTDHITIEKQDLSWATYWDGSYQEYLAQQARKSTGFREFFSRSYNQAAFTFFGKIANKNVVQGKNHELFLVGNIDDVTGKLLRSKYGTIEAAKSVAQENIHETLTLIDTLRMHVCRLPHQTSSLS